MSYSTHISIVIFYDALSVNALGEGWCRIQHVHNVDSECCSDVPRWVSTIL